jgi:hypothetical protein
MSVCFAKKQAREPQSESFEEMTCMTLDLIKVIKRAPSLYQPPLTLLLVMETGNEHELAITLHISQTRVKRAKRYLRRALIEDGI